MGASKKFESTKPLRKRVFAVSNASDEGTNGFPHYDYCEYAERDSMYNQSPPPMPFKPFIHLVTPPCYLHHTSQTPLSSKQTTCNINTTITEADFSLNRPEPS